MLDYINSKDKKREKQAPPQWFQESDFGQSVMQQRDKAIQWAGDTFGIQPPKNGESPYQQQGDQLKQQWQQSMMQTPIGQKASGYFDQVMKPLESATEKKQQQYQTDLQKKQQLNNAELNTFYNNAMKQLGLR